MIDKLRNFALFIHDENKFHPFRRERNIVIEWTLFYIETTRVYHPHMRECDKQLIIIHPLAEMKNFIEFFPPSNFLSFPISHRKQKCFLFLLFRYLGIKLFQKKNVTAVVVYNFLKRKIFMFTPLNMFKKFISGKKLATRTYTHIFRYWVKVHEKYLYSYYAETHHYVDIFVSSLLSYKIMWKTAGRKC